MTRKQPTRGGDIARAASLATGIDQGIVEGVLDVAFCIVRHELLSRDRVKIDGFGVFARKAPVGVDQSERTFFRLLPSEEKIAATGARKRPHGSGSRANGSRRR